MPRTHQTQQCRDLVVGAELRVRRGSHRAAMIGAWPFDCSICCSGNSSRWPCTAGEEFGGQEGRTPHAAKPHVKLTEDISGTDWSKGPAMVTGELTGLVLALDVSVPCPDFPTSGMPAGWAGARYLPGQPGSRPLYATTRSRSGALPGTGTGGSKMPLRASRSSGGYMPVMAARQASSVAGSCW